MKIHIHYKLKHFLTLPVDIFLITMLMLMEEGQAEFKETVLTKPKRPKG